MCFIEKKQYTNFLRKLHLFILKIVINFISMFILKIVIKMLWGNASIKKECLPNLQLLI